MATENAMTLDQVVEQLKSTKSLGNNASQSIRALRKVIDPQIQQSFSKSTRSKSLMAMADYGSGIATKSEVAEAGSPTHVEPKTLSAGLRQVFSSTSQTPLELAQLLKLFNDDPSYVAEGVKDGFPSFTAIQMGNLLKDPSLYPDITGLQMEDALEAAGYDQSTIVAALPQLGFKVDTFMRDNFSDNGTTPVSGSLYQSPDIITMPNQVPNYKTAFANRATQFGGNIEYGQDNYIYLRMKNLGTMTESPTAHLFSSPVNTFVNPTAWMRVGSPLLVPNIAPGESVVVGPIIWDKDAIPNPGHYCYICYLDSPLRPFSLPSSFPNTAAFQAFVSNNNNVAWRNSNVVNWVSGSGTDPTYSQTAEYTFEMQALAGFNDGYSLQLKTDIPANSRVKVEINGKTYETIIDGSGDPVNIVDDISLSATTSTEVKTTVYLVANAPKMDYEITMTQQHGSANMGSTTNTLKNT